MKNEVKREIGVAVLEVNMANPNGDPESPCGGPRVTADGKGLISLFCARSHIRRLLEDHDSDIYDAIKREASIKDDESYHIFESALKGEKNCDRKEALNRVRGLSIDEMLARFVDIRYFGSTALEKKKDKKDGEESKNLEFKRCQAVSMAGTKSISPINVTHIQMAKRYPLEESKMESKDGTFGDYECVEYGLYPIVYEIDPFCAKANRMSIKDVEVLRTAFKHIFYQNPSSARPSCCGIVSAFAFQTDNPMGCYPERANIIQASTPVFNGASEYPSGREDYAFTDLKKLSAKFPKYNVIDLLA